MKRAAAFVLLMLLAACAGPRPSAPPAATVVPPTQWRTAGASAGALEADWWRGFDDPVLAKIVEKALANNVDIAVSATRVEQARALFQSSRAQQRPNLTGAAGGVRERNVNPGFGIPEEQTAWEAELSVSYDLDLFGRLAHASDAARASLLASQAAHDNVRLAVASSAASGYIALRSLDARLVILRDTLAARADSLNLAKRRSDTGYAPTLDMHQAEAEYRATAQLIPATELAISRQENGLSVLLGESPRSIERGVQLVSLGLPQVPPGLPSDLLRRRPDVAQAERQVVAADRSLDSARDAFMPTVQLTASGGYVGSTLLEKTPLGIFSVGGSILAPLLDGGRLRAQADAAAARRDEAAFAYRKTVLVAFREVEDSLAAVDLAAEQERAVYAQREALALALAVATKRYRAGYSPYLEQLDAQRSLLSAELALVNIRVDRLNATVSLYQAMGGGWAAKEREPGADRLAGSAR